MLMYTFRRKHREALVPGGGGLGGGSWRPFFQAWETKARFSPLSKASGVSIFSLGACIMEPLLGYSCICLIPALLGWWLCGKYS